ncbi:hypothetical protein PYW08_010427 [Mythimna loreyi]|uniref:Uncharacterized protein n=1 Tax=Mythimna loreyi TaxID=667449 RepID=A0ACC2Q4R4_9NEOP|nr:hypothetical protein PYW08_010427 [Mythimna loreyi]
MYKVQCVLVLALYVGLVHSWDYTNSDYGQPLITLDHGVPTDVAIDSCNGFLYWMQTNTTTTVIERVKFDGSERKFITQISSFKLNSTLTIVPHSLTIDIQKQRKTRAITVPNPVSKLLTVANDCLLYLNLRYDKDIAVWKLGKLEYTENRNPFQVPSRNIYAGVAANYKIKDQIREIEKCESLSNLDLRCDYCVHGSKIVGKPMCKCKPGYIGKRCDVTVCKNYCINGNCTFDDKANPQCSCDAGYYGKRCEISKCTAYCQNKGVCSMKNNKPVCDCKKTNFTGPRCELSKCYNYCIYGDCSIDKAGKAQCRCEAEYEGKRCAVKKCREYCLNDGQCSLNKNKDPVCKCEEHYAGKRCQVLNCYKYCRTMRCKIKSMCSCVPGFTGASFKMDMIEFFMLK